MRLVKKLLLYMISLLLTGSIFNTESGELLDFDTYTREAYMSPIWLGDIVYNETLMFVEDENGTMPPAPLLYAPDEILSVRSFDLTVEYEQNIDYTVQNGCIVLTENSRIFKWSTLDYYPTSAVSGGTFDKTGGGFIAFGEGDTFFKTQVAVTYRHTDRWRGIVPCNIGDRLQKTRSKLANGEALTIIYYGDSITTGANSSNAQAPFAPIWTTLITQSLAENFGNTNITEINTAVGGTNAEWGAKNAKELVAAYRPDLVVIAFGMNDAHTSNTKYAHNIGKIICAARKANKDAEFILVSPMQANKEVKGFYGNQHKFECVLRQFECFDKGIAVAPVWSMHTYILRKKRYYDMTGNNVNHPNDFLARVYAQTVTALLIGKE
ncbi:MAG: SGNH/GDSL hydrolase family protein [Clostridiales bacterium]|nr:SGNH/GDSL hydrolase family protein [Clostridiales bacterium]